mgnify:CR=1
MEKTQRQFGVTFIGDVQDGEEETVYVDEKGIVELCNEDTDADVTTADGAVDFLREVGYSISIENVPEIDSAGFDSNGVNQYQEKLN